MRPRDCGSGVFAKEAEDVTNVNMVGPVPMPTGNQARDIEALALHMAKLQRQMELVVEELREVIRNGETA